jgi:ATP sulfurylase
MNNGKISRIDMIQAISLFFRKNGQYGPCRQNSTKAELTKIIQQYNINMDTMLIELAIERDAEQERRAKEEEEIRLKIENIKIAVSNMTDEQKEKFIESMNVLRSKYEIL